MIEISYILLIKLFGLIIVAVFGGLFGSFLYWHFIREKEKGENDND